MLEGDPQRVCTSKILWTRVRAAIVATLEATTLADLIPIAPTDLVAITPTDLIPTTPKKAVAA